MPKMAKDRAELILQKLSAFESLQRKNTDEIGWIALQFSVTPAVAEKMIEEARKLTGQPERTVEPQGQAREEEGAIAGESLPEHPGHTPGPLVKHHEAGDSPEVWRVRDARGKGVAHFLGRLAKGESEANADLFVRAPELLAENAQLRAEVMRLTKDLASEEAITKGWESTCVRAEEQRDALADALEALRNWNGATPARQTLKDRCDAALRAAGRL